MSGHKGIWAQQFLTPLDKSISFIAALEPVMLIHTGINQKVEICTLISLIQSVIVGYQSLLLFSECVKNISVKGIIPWVDIIILVIGLLNELGQHPEGLVGVRIIAAISITDVPKLLLHGCVTVFPYSTVPLTYITGTVHYARISVPPEIGKEHSGVRNTGCKCLVVILLCFLH